MSIELLRRAAALMRERAEAATPGPWRDVPMGSEGSIVRAGGNTITTARKPATCREFADAEYIASMHPDVALAMAAVLDNDAAFHESFGTDFASIHPSDIDTTTKGLLALARAYLGEEVADDA